MDETDKKQAIADLAQKIRCNPSDAMSWLELAQLIDEPGRKRECLQRALVIESDNRQAADQLAALDRAVLRGEPANRITAAVLGPPPTAGMQANAAISPEQSPQGVESPRSTLSIDEARHKPAKVDCSLFVLVLAFGALLVCVPLGFFFHTQVTSVFENLIPTPQLSFPEWGVTPPAFPSNKAILTMTFTPKLAKQNTNGYAWRKATYKDKTEFCNWMKSSLSYAALMGNVDSSDLCSLLDRYYQTADPKVLKKDLTGAAVEIAIWGGRKP